MIITSVRTWRQTPGFFTTVSVKNDFLCITSGSTKDNLILRKRVNNWAFHPFIQKFVSQMSFCPGSRYCSQMKNHILFSSFLLVKWSNAKKHSETVAALCAPHSENKRRMIPKNKKHHWSQSSREWSFGDSWSRLLLCQFDIPCCSTDGPSVINIFWLHWKSRWSQISSQHNAIEIEMIDKDVRFQLFSQMLVWITTCLLHTNLH